MARPTFAVAPSKHWGGEVPRPTPANCATSSMNPKRSSTSVCARPARSGALCDTRSADRFTELARAAASAQPGSPELVIGASAAAALGRLNPPDLAKRLAPLTNAAGSRLAQEVAKMAFGATNRCR